MQGRAHLLIGAASVSPLIVVTSNPWQLTGCLTAGLAASLAPDMDHPVGSLAISWPKRVGWHLTCRTRDGRKKRPNKLVDLVFFKALYSLMKGCSRVARTLSWAVRTYTRTDADRLEWATSYDPDHRALTHTGAAALLAALVAGLIFGPLTGIAVFLGWMSHLLTDACTVQGVPLLWPVKCKARRWHPVRFLKGMNLKSGARSDWWIAWTITALMSVPSVLLASVV